MSNHELSPVTPEMVEVTADMQKKCVEAYLTVASELRPGISEVQIAKGMMGELEKRGISDFWYDNPVLVLVGEQRFCEMANPSYEDKAPKHSSRLRSGDPFFIDMHPRHESGRWGNFAATGILSPSMNRNGDVMLRLMQGIQEWEMLRITGNTRASEVAGHFQDTFNELGISPLDVRGNFGHSMEQGLKSEANRVFLDSATIEKMGGRIFGIEPGGYQQVGGPHSIVVARFEDCVHVPVSGRAMVLGRTNPVSIAFGPRN
jgi:hypothetical protein